MKLVADAHYALCTGLQARVDFLSSTHPEDLELELIRGVPEGKLADGELELELDELNVGVQGGGATGAAGGAA